ncbi:HDX protein, partial [Amia calva]|nr:HDX protein [Amia calva]
MSCFSIAMETGDADDEYAREEELANMGAQMQICSARGSSGGSRAGSSSSEPGALRQRDSPGGLGSGRGCGGAPVGNTAAPTSSPLSSDSSPVLHPGSRAYQVPSTSSPYPSGHPAFFSSMAARSGFPGKLQSPAPNHGSPQSIGSFQVSGNLSVPWITSNSRKRTLQDRTQFSDRDLATLKKFWDNGMTSLGSVCREKITAVAAELNVDCEIIKTWIGNRRRKYRLMGIEIPPPKGGPADFTNQPEPGSPEALTPGGDTCKTSEPTEDSDRNDEVSICLSEDGTSDTCQQEEGEDGDGDVEMSCTALTDNVKIEIIDDEEDEDEDEDDASGSDVEQMQSFLEYKNEEVRYLESELENQKQKYYKLQTFTRNLLAAVKTNNTEKQQELLSSLPHEVEDNWDFSPGQAEPSTALPMIQGYSSVSEEKVDPGTL